MPVDVVDYSFTRPSPAGLAAAGMIGAVRYVPYPGDQGKGLTIGERDALHGAGLGIGLVFESTAGRATEGIGAGMFDASLVATALDALSWPTDRPVFYAVDKDTNRSEFAAIREYFRGVANLHPVSRIGIYGEFEIVAEIMGAGLASWAWQCSAWSGVALYPGRVLYQIGSLNGSQLAGGLVDYNDRRAADWGQWGGEFMPSQTEWENMKLRVFAGSERYREDEAGNRIPLTRAEKLALADEDIAQADGVQSIKDLSASAMVVAKAAGEGRIGPGVTAEQVEDILREELAGARIVPAGGLTPWI